MKKTKLIATIMTICLAVCTLAYGVYAATNLSFTIGANIAFEVQNLLVDVTGRVIGAYNNNLTQSPLGEETSIDEQLVHSINNHLVTYSSTQITNEIIDWDIQDNLYFNSSSISSIIFRIEVINYTPNKPIKVTIEPTQTTLQNLNDNNIVIDSSQSIAEAIAYNSETNIYETAIVEYSITPSNLISAMSLDLCFDVDIKDNSQLQYSVNGNEATITTIEDLGESTITIPSSVNGNTITTIGANALGNNTTVTTITLPNTITQIDGSAFSGCSNLSQISISEGNTTLSVQDGVLYNTIVNGASQSLMPRQNTLGQTTKTLVVYPQAKSGTTFEIPSDVTTISNYAFYNQTNLTNITFAGSNITSIGNSAFENCSGIESMDLGSNEISSVGTNAFKTNRTVPTKVLSTDSTATAILANNPNIISLDLSIAAACQMANDGFIDFAIKLSGNSLEETTYLSRSVSDSNIETYESKNMTISNSLNIMTYSSQNYSMSLDVEFNCGHYSDDGNLYICNSTESINCFYTVAGQDYSIYNTQQEYGEATHSSHYEDYNVISKDFNFTDWTLPAGKITLNYSVTTTCDVSCFVVGSLITLADGSTKAVENITYDDLLLVWNFDKGCYDASYPVWIQQVQAYSEYHKMTFEDGTELKLIVAHRLFCTDTYYFEKSFDSSYSQIGNSIYKHQTDANGNALKDANGDILFTSSKIVSIERIVENVTYINLITGYHLNVFVNSILTSTGFSNMFGTFDGQNMTYNLTKMNEIRSGGEGVNGTMHAYEDLDTEKIPYFMFKGYRAAEQKEKRDAEAINAYIGRNVDAMLTVPTNQAGNRIWAVSTTNADVFGANYETYKIQEGTYYTLPSPNLVAGKSFIGWYCSANGNTYDTGDQVQIWFGTHFTAIWE